MYRAMILCALSLGAVLHIGHFGDSTCITSYLPEEKRVHKVLERKLEAAFRGLDVVPRNFARGGDFIYRFLNHENDWGPRWKEGEGPKPGRYWTEARGKTELDIALIRYGQNDMKQYEPPEFGERLKELIARIRTDFPGVLVILETGTYFDPDHYGWAGINRQFDGYWQATRNVAKELRLPLVDNFRRWKEETGKGNWDLRIRRDGTLDASKDAGREKDKSWFANGHPNARGVELIVDEEIKVIEPLLARGALRRR